MNIKMPSTALSGQFRMVVSKDAEGERVKHDTGFFNNLITDVGMNRVGSVELGIAGTNTLSTFTSLCGRFVVGSGFAAPAVTDTALVAPVAFASANPVLDSESSSYERGWYEITVRHQFGQGQAAGNLSEIGIQHTNASGPLWSRALILDGAGDPTTITVLPDDFLTCYYTLRIMIPQEDTVFSIDVDYDADGVIPTVVTARPLGADSSRNDTGWGLRVRSTGSGGASGNALRWTDSSDLTSPTAAIIPGWRGGNQSQVAGSSEYIHGSFKRYVTISIGLNQLNGTYGLFSLTHLLGYWQVQFDPPLIKDDTQTMDLTFGYSWARAE